MTGSRPCYIIVGPEDSELVRASSSGEAPRLDYRELADLVGGTVIEGSPAPAQLGLRKPVAVLRSAIPNFLLSLRLVRRIGDGGVILSTGETWGLPCGIALALAGRQDVKHYIFVHRVFSFYWQNVLRILAGIIHVDGWFCVTEKQQEYLRETLGPKTTIEAVGQAVDTHFFDQPLAAENAGREPAYILAVGAEMRDYGLLLEAADGLDKTVVIKASSRWMRSTRVPIGILPHNVKLLERELSYTELRDLYAGAAAVVVPLKQTLQAAGITTILEAMAMGKCVIATQTAGLPDILVDGITGYIVAPDPVMLREALQGTLGAGPKYADIAANARESAETCADLDRHLLHIARLVSLKASREIGP